MPCRVEFSFTPSIQVFLGTVVNFSVNETAALPFPTNKKDYDSPRTSQRTPAADASLPARLNVTLDRFNTPTVSITGSSLSEANLSNVDATQASHAQHFGKGTSEYRQYVSGSRLNTVVFTPPPSEHFSEGSSFTQTLTPNNINRTDITTLPSVIYQHFRFTTPDFVQCFRSPSGSYLSTSGMYLNVTAISGEFVYDASKAKKLRLKRCAVGILVPPGMMAKFQLNTVRMKCGAGSLSFFKGVNAFANSKVVGVCEESGQKVTVRSTTILVVLSMFSFSRDYYVHVNFSAVQQSSEQLLKKVYITKYKGYITSPVFDSQTKYQPAINAWKEIEVPHHHSVMLTFLYLDIFAEFKTNQYQSGELTILKDGNTSHHIVQTVIGMTFPGPRVYEAHTMFIHLRTFLTNDRPKTGFKLLFSFHHYTAKPEEISNGTYNCSVTYWSDFQEHFPCNLISECAAFEDEEPCPYTNSLCGKGQFYVDDSCYLYVKTEGILSWKSASEQCQNRGAHLVSFNEETEWRDVMALLRHYNVSVFFTGLCFAPHALSKMYSDSFQWMDGTVAYFYFVRTNNRGTCSMMDFTADTKHVKYYGSHLQRIDPIKCDKLWKIDYVCEKDIILHDPKELTYPLLDSYPAFWNSNGSLRLIGCPSGHVTQSFLSYDRKSACWVRPPPVAHVPPMFACKIQAEFVPYALVCDYRPDCGDHSDEDFCVFPRCPAAWFHCGNQQCVPEEELCDNKEQCVNGVDEAQCERTPIRDKEGDRFSKYPLPAPGVVTFNGKGGFTIASLNGSSAPLSASCPLSHFACPGRVYYCLPVFTRCNSVLDCPRGEDEWACDRYTCPGMYHCRDSHVCVHASHMCDGMFQCPQHDDELYCHLSCPHNCFCYARAFFCHARVSLDAYPDLRFLDAKGSGMTPDDVTNNTLLIHLSLASCDLYHLNIPMLKNLQSLDLSDNHLVSVNSTQLDKIKRLNSLKLAGNPLTLHGLFADMAVSFLQKLDLSRVRIHRFNVSILETFSHLHVLNLSDSGVNAVPGDGFQSLRNLRVLDLQGCPVSDFPHHLFQGLGDLHTVYTDNYKLCCPGILPVGFNLRNCLAPSDDISSCETLLQYNAYRVALVFFGTVSLLCNLASFVYRAMSRSSKTSGFAVFVIHLCVSDFLMGVYLAMIGVADRLYHGTYAWKDTEWRHSVTCHIAGFLSFLSNEVSAFLICLITLDRFLVLRFPFSQFHFHHVSSHVACAFAWCLGLILAAVPLLPYTLHWNFYSQTGICIPLPITRKAFAGQKYSFGVIIVLNFVLFLSIAVGQCVVYWSIQSNSMSSADVSRKSKDQTVARRLLTIVMSDFLCWFPIGVLGLLASKGVAIPNQVNVTLAIIVMPLNASLNPFLYTLNLLQEHRRRAEESRMEKRLMSQLQAKYQLQAKPR